MFLYALLDFEGNVIAERSYQTTQPVVKLGPDDLPLLRPLNIIDPELEPWQETNGWEYEVLETEVNKTANIQSKDLSLMKENKSDAVDALLNSKLETGFEWPAASGKFVQLRPQDQQNIASSTLRAVAVLTSGGAMTWPADFEWRMSDNSFVAITSASQMLGMTTAAMDFVVALRKASWDHKDAILALSTSQAVYEYDITTDW